MRAPTVRGRAARVRPSRTRRAHTKRIARLRVCAFAWPSICLHNQRDFQGPCADPTASASDLPRSVCAAAGGASVPVRCPRTATQLSATASPWRKRARKCSGACPNTSRRPSRRAARFPRVRERASGRSIMTQERPAAERLQSIPLGSRVWGVHDLRWLVSIATCESQCGHGSDPFHQR